MCHNRERRRPKHIRVGRGGGTPRLGVATAGYLKIWAREASLYSVRKGPKHNLDFICWGNRAQSGFKF